MKLLPETIPYIWRYLESGEIFPAIRLAGNQWILDALRYFSYESVGWGLYIGTITPLW